MPHTRASMPVSSNNSRVAVSRSDSPGSRLPVTEQQLRDLHIRVRPTDSAKLA